MSRLLTWRVISSVLTASIVGLASCCLFGRGRSFFAYGGFGVVLIDVFAAAWSVALVVLLPLKIFQDSQRQKDATNSVGVDPSQMNVLAEAVLYANYGSLPKWFYLPFVTLAVLLALLAVFCVTLGVMWDILHGAAA